MTIRTLLAVAVAGALAACSAATTAADPAGATCDQFASTAAIEQSRTIEVGSELTVVLCSNASTGFSWGDPAVADASVLRLIDRVYRAADSASLPIVGAAGGDVFTFRGLAKGSTSVTIAYGQPWSEGIHDAWTYRLTVTVG